ncbi:ABC transporter substrate-binding protein [Marinobacter zhanjiangensis]|uniref:ABC transporter substrate-binding protein n=1 Tax=Marinobacter zhanjiangensis TaxID=578215 RepID=A0ABQ3AZV6_9GAMM|nr:iron-siderophore ABC transporter substrate-binding protein [Marinobacter zhanjiangensis]GGY73002.1 ABC transporter substrate-binding protein [Marinobacter zhanjiangensis]
MLYPIRHQLAAPLVALLLACLYQPLLADTRTIPTAYGDVTVEGQPESIVTLYEGALDSAIAVGAQPVGAIITRGGQSVASYIEEAAGVIEIVGAPGETNLEAVIALQPDLILAAARTSEEQYQLLSRIAPTVVLAVTPYQHDTWKRELALFARALGREDRARDVIERVEQRAAEVRRQVETVIPEDQRDTALVRWMPQGPLVMAEGLFSATVLASAGFEVDDAGLVSEGRPHSQPLSQENLSLMDRNWIFLATLNEDGREALEAARQAPAFKRLVANESGRILPVDGTLWTSASGPLAALAILDEIEAALK